MDARNSSPRREMEGAQQPSGFPILSDNDNSIGTSDDAPPLLPPSQQEIGTRHTLATEPFQPILEVLADLERVDPDFYFLAARLVGLYRHLWESCVSKHIGGEMLEQSNQKLKESSMNLSNKRDGLQLRHDKQLSQLRHFEQALEPSRERLISLLDDWNYPFRPNLMGLPDVVKEG
ncbi:unnamed protein product [Penicillium egyptiacum]|uniref:Uncharacterized protein n=1 Tax=Penicillium egyptiacum TaxID=1303716 RepID=A0A9W4P4A1_9EURO|nr:unnamed protein product [Penicillium egyptiacum]